MVPIASRHATCNPRFEIPTRRLSESGKPGRPTIPKEVRELIQDMWRSNPTRGSPRIVGELRKFGNNVAKSTVETYRPPLRKPPSPTWKVFLSHHVKDIVACDFFTVPTAFQNRVGNLGLEEVQIAPQSPWQNPYCERVIGRIRRDALDHVIVLTERHLRRVLRTYVDDHHAERPHQGKDNVILFPAARTKRHSDMPIDCRERLGGL